MAKRPSKNDALLAPVESVEDPSAPFVHRWNELVSVTNWEKGRIICQWRESLAKSGAPASQYADEAWAECVGHVTGQHVGRLRRVFQRFGAVCTEYPGLYWSHFQVAMDWDDAEMWLEGAVQSGWSVSQMRAARWEAHGAPASLKPRDEDIIVGELDEDATIRPEDDGRLTPRSSTVRDVGGRLGVGADEEPADAEDRSTTKASRAERCRPGDSFAAGAAGADERKRPFEDLPKLPDDLAEAFEQLKLVILAHKMAGWSEISRDDMLACLDALKELALQPAGD
jgi:hypothetical protein